MKKTIAMLLAVLTVFLFSTVAFAEGTTTLTTTVPDAEYMLNIPANQAIPYGKTSTDIGSITVTDASGFAEGKNLQVTLDYTDFTCAGVKTTIPFKVYLQDSTHAGSLTDRVMVTSGSSILFEGKSDGSVNEEVYQQKSSPSGGYLLYMDDTLVQITSENWGKALAGNYTATITFTAEVVAE